MRSREDEIRLLQLQIQEEKREIALSKKKLPVKRALDQELELYRIQVSLIEIYLRMFFFGKIRKRFLQVSLTIIYESSEREKLNSTLAKSLRTIDIIYVTKNYI